RWPALLFPSWRSRLFWELKVRAAIRRADLVFTVSETSRRDILQAFRLPAARVRVVSDAVDPRFKPPAHPGAAQAVLRRYGLEPGQRFVLYVGGISPHKNLETLVRAFGRWRRDQGTVAMKLVLVGDFAADVFYSSYPSLRDLIASSALEGDVRFAGFVPDDDLVHFYGATDVLVLPSLSEGFGLPALEAMACGAPVIASEAGALPEVVGNAGLLFPPRSADSLAAALGRVLGDATLRAGMGARGLVQAAQFTWDASARAALAGFQELAG
ncbi:MAG TPA: glycosyltransferase family 1 protein, partial [bacterium]